MPIRLNALHTWLNTTLTFAPHNYTLTPLAGDASFRRYFRLHHQNTSYIVMDAPPEKEPITSFIEIGEALFALGIHAPKILAKEIAHGFLLLEDFGDQLLLHAITQPSIEDHYQEALDTLVHMQQSPTSLLNLPFFDINFMLQELEICREWFLRAYLNLSLKPADEILLTSQFQCLAERIATQPSVFVHRDYHSKNLMLIKPPLLALGVIDFQDAMLGPFTYDLVSLLKDCYVQIPPAALNRRLHYFYNQLPNKHGYSFEDFQKAFELCGIQRHLKVLGVFARLHLRDQKSAYLRHLPLTLNYILQSLSKCPELTALYQWFNEKVTLHELVT